MQDQHKPEQSLESQERAGIVETRIATLRAMVLSVTQKNEVLEDRLASLHLMQTAPGEKGNGERAEGGRSATIPWSGKRWLALGAAAMVMAAVAGLCVPMLRPESPDRDGQRIEKELIAARKKVSDLEADLKTQAEAPVEHTRLLQAAIVARDAEIERSRLEVGRLRKEVDGLRGNLSSSSEEKEGKIAELEDGIAWMKEKSRETIAEIKREKGREIEVLQKDVKRLTLTKGVAIPGLIDAMDHQDPITQKIIARTLTELTGKSFGTNQGKWQDWWRKNRINFIRR